LMSQESYTAAWEVKEIFEYVESLQIIAN